MTTRFRWDPSFFDLTQLIAPAECLGCGAIKTPPICRSCHTQLEPLPPGCRRCGNPGVHSEAANCPWCQRLQHPGDHICSLLSMRNTGRELFHQAKYNGYHRLIPLLLDAGINHFYQNLPFLQYQTLIPIPESQDRKLKRPFNPAEILARALANRTGLSLTTPLRRRGKGRQVGRDAKARFDRAAGAMHLAAPIPYRAVILVDDVLTTGATLQEATRVLKKAGVSRVAWMTLFREL